LATVYLSNQKVVYFPILPKQCFCNILENRQAQKLHLFTHVMITVAEALLSFYSLNLS